MNTIAGLTEKILRGYRIKRGDDLSLFLTAPLDELHYLRGLTGKAARIRERR